MLADPDAFKRGCASWDRLYTASRFMAIIVENSSAVTSTVGFAIRIAALLT